MTPLLAEDGTCVGVYGVGQDVTEWAIQEKQYATVMMQANAPIIELDKEGNITVWNSKTESMTGYASVDMLGEPLLPVVDESFRKIVSEKIEQALSGIAGADFELPLVTARGSRVEIVLCLTPRFDTLGSVMGVVAIGQDVTERNTKEMEYKKLIETANAPIFGVDTEGRVVIFNAKAAQISEYAPDEVMGVDLVDTLISEDFRSEVAAVFQRAFQGIETANFEFPLVTKTGRKVELLLNATPRYDHTGQLVGVVGIGQDITDRIIQEKEYSRLIDTANAPIFGVDCNCEVIIWNKKAAAITDYTNEDTIGQKIFKFISEDYRDVVGKVLSKAMEGEGTANFDFPLITKSGRRLDILLNATPKYDHFGNICGAVGIGQDITDRRAQEQEYTRLIDTANAPIFGVDENGCVNIWNRKAADTTQYSNEEVLGVNLVENFIPDDFQEAVWTVLSEALKGQETANFEFPLITKDGRRVEILLNATPRYNEKGVVIGVVGIGQDITVRMAQEKETNRLIHSANAPIFGVDQDGRVNIWNLKVAEITQFSSQEIMGKDLVNRFVAEDHRESVGLLLRKALQGEQTGNFDFPIITKTGRRVEILLNATPRYDELGQIFGVMGIGQDITERIAQEQEYIRLIDTANAPIFGVDSEGRVNIWNKKAAEIMQYTTDAVMGEKLVEKYITKDYQDAVRNVLSEALNGVETANFEFPLITKAGRRVEILLNATPRYNEHGAVIGMVGIGQDITDRIAQEQEYMRLIDTANAPIFGVDINGRVNIWNRKAAETTQYTNAEVLGKDLVAEFISEEYKVPVRSVLEKAFQDVETANFEFPLITKAGRRVEILLNATPRYNEQGQVMGMVGIGQDITVRMAQEKEKNRMIHSANAPIFGVDQDGLVNIWNLKVAEITQFSSEEVMGQDLVNRFVAEDHRDEVNFNLRKALEGKPTGNFDFPLITKTGRRVEILLNATPRYDELGQIFGVTGIGQDITERIAQEQEYIRLIDTANAPIFGVNSEGRVNIWNKKAASIMQYTTDAVMGEKLVEKYITKDYQEAVSNVLSEALNGVETANFEFPLITKAGRRVEILLNATPRYNEHGAVIGMVGIGQDITDRIAQEQEYTRLIDTANAPIFGVDINGRVNIWNRKAADIMQYTNEDVLGKDLVAEFISEEYKVPVRSVLEKAFEGIETANFEFPLITKAGRRVEILLNATPRYNERGEVMGMVGIGQDITERIAQEEEYSRLIDTANAPIFGVDINGRAFEGVETANFEFPLITRAGRRVEILLNATPRYNERGEVMGMVGIGQDITDRIAQEQEHSRMIDTANAPIFGVDTDGRVNIWNRKAADIMQYTNEDVLGKNLVEQFISEEYRVAVRSVLEKAFEGVETANFEFPLITRAGRRVEILLNATPRYNERGEVMGMVGIGQDITERIAQEQEYSRLIDTANAPIFGVDINGRVNIWNRKAAHIMQYTNEDVLDKDLVAEFISEEYKVPVRSVLEKAFEGVETANFEFPLITKAGRRVEILLNATPRYNEHGEVMGMVGIGQDITERIAQEQEYTRLIDTANAPIFGVDINGHVNIWNRKAAHIMQYTNEDVLGKDLVAEFISNEYKVPVRSVLEKAFEGIETANFEFPLITKAGRRVEILLNATPRYNERGEVMGMVGIGQDITERIAQEEEYSRLIDTANAPIFGVDINGRVNIWNRKAADIMQYTNEDVLGKDLVAEFISKEYKVPVRSVLEKAFEGVETANFEFPLITRAGRRVEILLNATPRYNERGEVMGMVGIGQDITDRIAQEQEYTRLIDSANAPIFGVDVNGCVNIWNKKAAEITQYTPNDVMGENLVEKFITEDYRKAVGLVLSKALDGVETANFEFPLMTKAGRRVEILLNATSRFNEHGEVIGMVGIGQDITERIAQEQEYTRLIDTANAPIFGVDINGRVNIWNRKAAETTQYTNAEVLGKDLVAEFISKEYKVPVRSVLEKAFEGVETANFEFPLITKAGRRVEILLNATPRYNEHGEVMGMVGIGQDITERIAQEQEYTRLIDTANAPIFGVDINGHVNIWNRKAADIMQYSNEDVLGKDLVVEFISNEYKVPVRSVLEKAFEGIETANFEFPLITKAGRRVEILLNATPRYNERGEVMGMVGIGQDITERIAQEQEYSRLIDTANAPIFGVDINGHVNIWNRKAAHIMQYTNEDVLGKDLVAEFISNEYKVPVRSVLEKAFEGVETANFEFPLITKAGRRVEILLNATPRYNEHGEVKGMVGIGQDITERIAQEQEYSRLIDTANAPIFGVDINGHVNIWNRKAADIMQYTNEDVLGKDLVAEFISKEYKVPVRSVLEKAFEGIETANFEFPLITKAGRRVEILLNATPRYNERGEVMGMVGIGQDITERIAQEEEYSRLIDTANAPIFGVDINGCVNIWNRKAADIMQYTNEDVLGKDLVAEFISKEYKEPVRSVLEKAFEGVETANFEFPLITKAGRRVEILLNATPRYNERGDVMGMVGIGQDITERIAQEQEYSRLIDTANAPIFGVDTNMRINIFNRKAQQITNFSSEELVGEMYVETIISQEFKAVTYDIMCKALQGNETASFELALTTKTGRKVNILLNATARFDQHGQIVGVVGIGQDITDRIAQEQEYTRLIDSANAPIFGVDVNGCVNIWNKKAAEITQYTPNDVMGENLVEKFITEDYREAVGLVFSKACEGTETANFEFPLMTKAGRRVEILLNATSRFNEIGEVMGVVGIGQDITERIAQEQEYTRLIDTANAPIFGVDINGRVNIWNRKAAETTQYTNAEVLGKDLVAEFISNEYKMPVRSVLEKAFEGIETANFEFPLITKAGRRVEILLNATPRYNEHGEVMGMVGIGQDITERIAQEQEYTRLIDTANAPIFGVDINGHVNIWNRKAAHIMQYTNEDVLGKDLVAEFISEEYKVPVRSVLEKAFEGVETANFEFPLITKAGRRVEILLNATPRYNEHGEVKGMVGIGQDITERIAQEQEYSRLIDTANAPIFGVDANMCVNIWNRKAAQITNYSIGEVMGENLVETFISPEFRPIVAEVLSQALTGVETANFEFPLITRPGTRIEILLNATPRYDLNGNIVGVVGIGQDITDRIAQEHEYFRLIDTANAPIFGIDNNGRINEWNQKIEEITGYHKSNVLGLSLVHTFVTPDCRQQVRQLLNQALIGIDVGEMELPMTTKRGVFLLLLVNASSKKDMHGNIRGVIGVGQDYTARKHMEAAKVNFLASFSHELRTPLNGVLGMLELLKEQPLDKSIERYVHMAYVSGSLLLNLINDILDLSKIEAGHLEISTAPFQMHDLLDYSIEIFKFKAKERGLKLELKCGDNVPKAVIGDVVRLRQVLLNLLSNAIKFTNEGSITVACSVVHSPELPPQFKKLLFQVIDTGIGMDAEEKMRLFSLFTKLERTRQNNPTGSGLGLAICKQLAELMDGSIDVDSELGVGSNFFFTVVVRLIDEVDPKHAYYSSEDFLDPSTALLSPNGGVRAGENGENSTVRAEVPKQARILVVEDNEFNWEVVKCFLQQDDHLLQWEVNGRDAVKAYSENHTEFDLVFMDCEMPIMDGYTATNAIREFEQKHNLSRIPILGLTAYAMSGDRQKCLDCGMDEFMVKPISKLSLRKAIRQWMRIRYLGQHNAALGAVPGVVGQPLTLRNGPRPTAKSPMRIPAPAPGALTPMPSFENDLEDVTLMDAASTARLAPASRHMQQLDLAQAISNLELDDPMSIGLQSGRAVRTATPTTSIFSLGPSVNNIARQTSTNDLPDVLRLSRNTSGASTATPAEREKPTETSTTLPYVKTPFIGVMNSPAQHGARSPLSNPTLWSHPPFNTKDLPSERPHAWSGLAPKKKVSFHEELEASHPSRTGHSSIGSSMPSVLEHMETGSSMEDDAAVTATITPAQGALAVSHSIDPMSIEIPEGDPVNYSLGVDQCGGQEGLLLTLLEKFATTSEAITTRVVEAHERNDFVTARREAHSLKGSSAYVAALRVSKCAFRVQVAYEHLMAQQATGEGSDTLAAKQIVDDSVRLLRTEQRLLRGYLRRNFEFKNQAGPSQVTPGQLPYDEDKPTGPCLVM
ncbi:hybrid signal transduction histidine kinase, putative [Phytophthora infestans T30-4]|uniref:histidine kinase n=1 Tax=Phytophthora infestans (strain T30-4) TaxID=403677 RepID=D0NMV9_PHYIT|nr:hybrid signal transduction histidine kinase, putative [Phytophthora infestans T30-4]EEY61866.1 hybrid signal transduction histidine kinase, putative [Phytophthora infestans T30-4]|eukprot:XP_002899506.1 hybrid signal transduction histidine kinase, putative [Phytophthora infestans T30-4]